MCLEAAGNGWILKWLSCLWTSGWNYCLGRWEIFRFNELETPSFLNHFVAYKVEGTDNRAAVGFYWQTFRWFWLSCKNTVHLKMSIVRFTPVHGSPRPWIILEKKLPWRVLEIEKIFVCPWKVPYFSRCSWIFGKAPWIK